MNPITYLWIFLGAMTAFLGIAQIVFLNAKQPATMLRMFFFGFCAVLTTLFIALAVGANS